jgi:hypothetical protein
MEVTSLWPPWLSGSYHPRFDSASHKTLLWVAVQKESPATARHLLQACLHI